MNRHLSRFIICFTLIATSIGSFAKPASRAKIRTLQRQFDKAYLLETQKNQVNKALDIYRKIVSKKRPSESNPIVKKALQRLLLHYSEQKLHFFDQMKLQLNFDLEQGSISSKSKSPRSWYCHNTNYETTVDNKIRHTGKYSARLERKREGKFKSTGMTKSIKPDMLLGKKIRYSGYMKLDKVTNYAALWLRADAGKKRVAFHSMYYDKIKGTRDWQYYSFVIKIPENTTIITFGALLSGGGTLWVDDLDIEILDTEKGDK